MSHFQEPLSASSRSFIALLVLSSVFASTARAAPRLFDGSELDGCSLTDVTYTCDPDLGVDSDDLVITPEYVVVITGSGDVLANTAAIGINSKLYGNLTTVSTVALGAGAYLEGDTTAGSTAALDVDTIMIGNLSAGTTVALGAGAYLEGGLTAGSTAVLGADAIMIGNL
ncbi:MAG: putative acyltransferase (DUF342 family), partial [Myxococcota bacterium]